jgi:hypothetical protein
MNLEEGSKVKKSEDKVHFPGNRFETRWNSESESSVKCPIGCLAQSK